LTNIFKMARTKGKPTPEDMNKARQVVARFGNLSLNQMDRGTLSALVSVWYGDNIRGKPLDEIPENQLYRIAERLYFQSISMAGSFEPLEKQILGKIGRLYHEFGNSRDAIEDTICIMLEGNHLPHESFLARKYEKAKNATPF